MRERETNSSAFDNPSLTNQIQWIMMFMIILYTVSVQALTYLRMLEKQTLNDLDDFSFQSFDGSALILYQEGK